MIKLLEELTDFSLYLLSYMTECNSAIAESSVLLHWFRALKMCLMFSLLGTYSSYLFCHGRKVVCVCLCIMEKYNNKKHTHCEKGKLVQAPPPPGKMVSVHTQTIIYLRYMLVKYVRTPWRVSQKYVLFTCISFLTLFCVLFVKMIFVAPNPHPTKDY